MKTKAKRERPKRPTHKFHLPFWDAYDLYQDIRLSDWKLLPESGGLLDQNPLIMADIRAIANWEQYLEYDIEHPEIPAGQVENARTFKDLARNGE